MYPSYPDLLLQFFLIYIETVSSFKDQNNLYCHNSVNMIILNRFYKVTLIFLIFYPFIRVALLNIKAPIKNSLTRWAWRQMWTIPLLIYLNRKYATSITDLDKLSVVSLAAGFLANHFLHSNRKKFLASKEKVLKWCKKATFSTFFKG